MNRRLAQPAHPLDPGPAVDDVAGDTGNEPGGQQHVRQIADRDGFDVGRIGRNPNRIRALP